MKANKKFILSTGFTIIELLVTMVVIGILMAIVAVSYVGIKQKAIVASLQSDLSDAYQKLILDKAVNFAYPNTLAEANDGKGITASSGTTFSYAANNPTSSKTFCLNATNSGQSYKITDSSSQPVSGNCLDYGLVLELDVGDGLSYPSPFTGATWFDLSSNGHNGTLKNGLTYDSSAGGSLIFNGTDDYVNYVGGGYLPTGDNTRTIMFWFKPNSGMSSSNGAFSYGCTGVAEQMSCGDQGVGRYVSAWANTSSIGIHAETCAINGVATPNPQTGWHYFTAVFNGNNTVTFYVDGGVNSITSTPACTINSGAGAGFAVGVGRWGYYSGQISTVYVYNIALSPTQVSQSFNTLKGRYGF